MGQVEMSWSPSCVYHENGTPAVYNGKLGFDWVKLMPEYSVYASYAVAVARFPICAPTRFVGK
jgi:hypothetical protein